MRYGAGDGTKDKVRSAGRALEILTFLARRGEAPLGEVSRYLGLRKSTVHRFLSTLQELGYVEQDGAGRSYRPGVRALEMALLIQQKASVCDLARPYLDRLASAVRETVNLAVLDGYEVLYLDKRESPEPLTVTARVGERKPAHCTALGKALLAYLPRERLDGLLSVPVLPAFTLNSITDPEKLGQQLEQVRAEGLAYDREEVITGVRCVAAPVFDHRGQVAAAISITVPTVRMSAERERAISSLLKETAKELSRRLGWQENPGPGMGGI